MWLKENPWGYRHRKQRVDYEQVALKQGHVAVNSVLRDWIKGQITAIETGIMSFEAVFMPFMLTNDGRTVLERIQETKMLPARRRWWRYRLRVSGGLTPDTRPGHHQWL